VNDADATRYCVSEFRILTKTYKDSVLPSEGTVELDIMMVS
jgi:hypothetical protein